MKPSLRRSPLLWLGLFGLAFLLWAAVDSIYHRTRLSRSGGQSAWMVENVGLTVGIQQMGIGKEMGVFGESAWEDVVQRDPNPATEPPILFRRPLWQAYFERDPSSFYQRELLLPHWLILLAYLLLWSSLLAWRSRRIARHLRKEAPAGGQGTSSI